MDKRQSKGKREVVLYVSYECIPPNSQGVRCGDDFLSYLATTISRSGRLFIPNVRTKSKKLTATYGFIKATSQEERNASPITPSDWHSYWWRRNHTNGLQNRLGIGFPNACCVHAKDTSSNQAAFIGAISSHGMRAGAKLGHRTPRERGFAAE
jgi:hypothetical protein